MQAENMGADNAGQLIGQATAFCISSGDCLNYQDLVAQPPVFRVS